MLDSEQDNMNHTPAIYASITPEFRANQIVSFFAEEANLQNIGAYTDSRKAELLADRIAKEINCAVVAAVAAERLNARP